MRTAIAVAFVVALCVSAGCAGPGTSDGDGNVSPDGEGTTPTTADNEFGAHPDSPANGTANGTANATAAALDSGGAMAAGDR